VEIPDGLGRQRLQSKDRMARKRQRYTPDERQRALAAVPKLGVVGAAAKHGIPASCVSRWNKSAAQSQPSKTTDGIRRKVAGARSSPRVAKRACVQKPSGNSKSSTVQRETPDRRAPQAPVRKPLVTRAASVEARATSHEKRSRRSSKHIARSYTPSERAAALELVGQVGPTKASDQLGISRYSLWDWKRRVEKAAQGQGDAPTAGASTESIEAQRDKEILDEWHRQPGLGPSQIKNQLRRNGVKVAVQTVRRVMEEQGYRPPKVKRSSHDQRYEAVRPNQLWHLDFVHRHINRASTNTLILIDDYSRFVVGHGVDEGERADMVLSTFERAIERHGRPEKIMHDKGSAFWSWRGIARFTALLTELGIDQMIAEHKEWNGKVEVFNANLHKEFFDVHRFYDVAEMKRRLETHLHWYNHARTHHSLGGLLVPGDRYYGRVEEVLARIEAGAGRDASDLLDLRDRCLELFKVISHGGVPEVWLLGQKLLKLGAPPLDRGNR
jgi:putative transposase